MVIKIIESTESSIRIGFHENKDYKCQSWRMGIRVINDNKHTIDLEQLVLTGATIKFIK